MADCEAFFLPAERGRRFCILHPACIGRAARGAIVYAHPFAEEMNKSRRTVALAARALAAAGVAVLQVDLYGCGDSDGDFVAADWSQWQRDVATAAAWLGERTGRPPMLWGLRAGCLLASTAACALTPTPDLLLWQPVHSGRAHLQQLLRLKFAGELVAGEAVRGGVAARAQWQRGESVEIAGYAIAPALAAALEAATLSCPPPPARVAWLETGGDGAELAPATQRIVREWHAAGTNVVARAVAGSPFWQSLEIAECPALVAATQSIVAGWLE